jgi:hypothetical protein
VKKQMSEHGNIVDHDQIGGHEALCAGWTMPDVRYETIFANFINFKSEEGMKHRITSILDGGEFGRRAKQESPLSSRLFSQYHSHREPFSGSGRALETHQWTVRGICLDGVNCIDHPQSDTTLRFGQLLDEIAWQNAADLLTRLIYLPTPLTY